MGYLCRILGVIWQALKAIWSFLDFRVEGRCATSFCVVIGVISVITAGLAIVMRNEINLPALVALLGCSSLTTVLVFRSVCCGKSDTFDEQAEILRAQRRHRRPDITFSEVRSAAVMPPPRSYLNLSEYLRPTLGDYRSKYVAGGPSTSTGYSLGAIASEFPTFSQEPSGYGRSIQRQEADKSPSTLTVQAVVHRSASRSDYGADMGQGAPGSLEMKTYEGRGKQVLSARYAYKKGSAARPEGSIPSTSLVGVDTSTFPTSYSRADRSTASRSLPRAYGSTASTSFSRAYVPTASTSFSRAYVPTASTSIPRGYVSTSPTSSSQTDVSTASTLFSGIIGSPALTSFATPERSSPDIPRETLPTIALSPSTDHAIETQDFTATKSDSPSKSACEKDSPSKSACEKDSPSKSACEKDESSTPPSGTRSPVKVSAQSSVQDPSEAQSLPHGVLPTVIGITTTATKSPYKRRLSQVDPPCLISLHKKPKLLLGTTSPPPSSGRSAESPTHSSSGTSEASPCKDQSEYDATVPAETDPSSDKSPLVTRIQHLSDTSSSDEH